MTFTLATFNVKDLLAPRNDAERSVLPAKLDCVARMVRACDADVIGLQEVGPPELLARVLDRLEARGGYGEPVIGTADARGIRCALLSRLPIIEARVHTALSLRFPGFREGDPPPFGDRIPLRRGVVHARIETPGFGAADVFVAHFKSSRAVPARSAAGDEIPATTAHMRAEASLRALVWRAAEALHVRRLVDDAMGPPHRAAFVAVVGDLNDVPDSTVVRTVRGEGLEELFDCASGIPAQLRFSTLHDGRASQIDHVLASAPLHARLGDARFLNSELRTHPPIAERAAKGDARGGAGGAGGMTPDVPTIDSDHAPLVTRFR